GGFDTMSVLFASFFRQTPLPCTLDIFSIQTADRRKALAEKLKYIFSDKEAGSYPLSRRLLPEAFKRLMANREAREKYYRFADMLLSISDEDAEGKLAILPSNFELISYSMFYSTYNPKENRFYFPRFADEPSVKIKPIKWKKPIFILTD